MHDRRARTQPQVQFLSQQLLLPVYERVRCGYHAVTPWPQLQEQLKQQRIADREAAEKAKEKEVKKREKERKKREKDRKKEAKEREKEMKRKEKVWGGGAPWGACMLNCWCPPWAATSR